MPHEKTVQRFRLAPVTSDPADRGVEVEVEVDLEGIARRLGPKAATNMSRRATAMQGLIVVRLATKAAPK